MEEITIGDKTYISSKRAAEITGYAKDYVGQLCREGRIEATLVGRSWYVLESSIRAHRFGSEPVESGPRARPSASDTWQTPVYRAEMVSQLPDLSTETARKSINVLDQVPQAQSPETIADMQSAWKEWFSTRSESMIESPEVIDAREEAAEVTENDEDADETVESFDPVPLTPEVEEEVPILRNYTIPRPTVAPVGPVEPPQRARKSRKRRKPSLALRALLISITLLVAAVTAINLGVADSQLRDSGATSSVIRMLGGASLLNK